MQQLHSYLVASPDDGGLLGSRHSETNDVIISDTMICSLALPQLRPMTENQKMMCGCAICNTSKYMQEYLNHMLTMHFQKKKLVTHVVKMQKILLFVHQLMMNVNFLIGNVSCGSILSVVLLLYQE